MNGCSQQLPAAGRLTGSRCQCGGCGERFNSASVFDRHRVGPHGLNGAGRRCLDAAEMADRGWTRNPAGFWTRFSCGRHHGTARPGRPVVRIPALSGTQRQRGPMRAGASQ